MMKHDRNFSWKQIAFTVMVALASCSVATTAQAQVQQLTIQQLLAASHRALAEPSARQALRHSIRAGYMAMAVGNAGFVPYTVCGHGGFAGQYLCGRLRTLSSAGDLQGWSRTGSGNYCCNPTLTGLTLTPGNIYTLAGGRIGAMATSAPTGSTTKALYCNGAGTGPIANSSNGDNCPAGEAYIKPRTIALDKDGNVYFSSGAGAATVRVVYVGGL